MKIVIGLPSTEKCQVGLGFIGGIATIAAVGWVCELIRRNDENCVLTKGIK